MLSDTRSTGRDERRATWAMLWSTLAGLTLWFTPPQFVSEARGVVLDGLRPGLQMVAGGQRVVSDWWHDRAEATATTAVRDLVETRAALSEAQAVIRRLTAQLADQNQQLALQVVGNADVTRPPRLFAPAIVEASVVGETLRQDWRDGRILDRGSRHGLRESAWVLANRQPLLDVGEPEQLQPEDTVFTGRAIIGKVVAVGRWSSTFLPVTDAEFRGRAQLVRETPAGPTWGAIGMLRGDGQRCRLVSVGSEDAVRPGDLVFTAERDGAIEDALYYGRVVDAQLGSEDREWTITVEPAPLPAVLTTVSVLRATFNPQRLWTN